MTGRNLDNSVSGMPVFCRGEYMARIIWRKDLTGPLAQTLQQMEKTAQNLGRAWQIGRANCFVLECDTEHKTVSIRLEHRYVDGGRYPVGRTIWVRNKAAYAEVEKAGQIRVITDLEAM